MIKSLVLVFTLVSLGAYAQEKESEHPKAEAGLDKVVTVETGDLMAVQIGLLFASGVAKEKFDAPVLSFYDRKRKKLILSIMGSRDTVEGGRKTLDEFRDILAPFAKTFLGSQYGVQLSDENTTIVYFGRVWDDKERKWAQKELVRREGGKFITP